LAASAGLRAGVTLVHRAAALATSRGPCDLSRGAAALWPVGSALIYRNVGLAFVGNCTALLMPCLVKRTYDI
jgi:hypothetical protein